MADSKISTYDHKTGGNARFTAYHKDHPGKVGYGETKAAAIADLNPKIAAKKAAIARLFIGTFPTGLSYADRSREKNGDYLKMAFLPYSTLELEWAKGVSVPAELRTAIESDARKLQNRRGESYQVSTSGQTVILGLRK